MKLTNRPLCSILPLLDKTSEKNLQKKTNHCNPNLNWVLYWFGKEPDHLLYYGGSVHCFCVCLTAIMHSAADSLVKTNTVSIYPSLLLHTWPHAVTEKPLQTNPSLPQCLSPLQYLDSDAVHSFCGVVHNSVFLLLLKHELNNHIDYPRKRLCSYQRNSSMKTALNKDEN